MVPGAPPAVSPECCGRVQSESGIEKELFLGQFIAPFRVVRAALRDGWYTWPTLLAINALWLLCCVTIVLAPPATFALFAACYELGQGRGTSVGDFVRGIRQHFVKSWGWGFLNAAAGVLFYANSQFYGRVRADWGALLLAVSLLLAPLWITVQLYGLAYFMAQEQPRLRTALRNGLFTLFASPLYSAVFAALVVAIGYLCVNYVVGLFIGGPALIALLSTHAVRERLRAFKIVVDPPAEDIDID